MMMKNISVMLEIVSNYIVDHEIVRLSQKPLADRIKYIIHHEYHRDLKLTDIAREVGYVPSYVCRVFKRETGETISAYIMKERTKRASELLTTTKLPISRIANMVGLPDQNYFARVFKRWAGTSPSRFRKNDRCG